MKTLALELVKLFYRYLGLYPALRWEQHLRQPLEIPITGQIIGPKLCCGQRDLRIQGNHLVCIGKGDDLIGLILPDFAREPFGQFQLHDRRRQLGLGCRELEGNLLVDWGGDQLLDPSGRIDNPHQTRSVRSR